MSDRTNQPQDQEPPSGGSAASWDVELVRPPHSMFELAWQLLDDHRVTVRDRHGNRGLVVAMHEGDYALVQFDGRGVVRYTATKFNADLTVAQPVDGLTSFWRRHP